MHDAIERVIKLLAHLRLEPLEERAKHERAIARFCLRLKKVLVQYQQLLLDLQRIVAHLLLTLLLTLFRLVAFNPRSEYQVGRLVSQLWGWQLDVSHLPTEAAPEDCCGCR